MDAFVNVVRKEPKVRIKIKDTLDRYMRLPYKYQSKIGHDCLIQNIILKELINLKGYYNNRFRYRIKKEN